MFSKINRRVAAKQNHLSYNRGGYCLKDLSGHINKNIIFPELKDSSCHKYIVPLLYRIRKDGTIYDIAVESGFVLSDTSYKIATSETFEMEAIRLLAITGKWRPFSFKDNYVDREGRFLMPFDYHSEYFSASNSGFELNPDHKATFNGDYTVFKKIIHPENGCDGMVTFLVIIEKDGSMTNEYCLNSIGKTNPQIGLSYLRKLTPWKPALKDGKPVRSQIKITVATQ